MSSEVIEGKSVLSAEEYRKRAFDHIADTLGNIYKANLIVHITHGDDADGAGCSVVLENECDRIFENLMVKHPNIHTIRAHAGDAFVESAIDEAIAYLGDHGGEFESVLILVTDLRFSESGYAKLQEATKNLICDIAWVDHHIATPTTEDVLVVDKTVGTLQEFNDIFPNSDAFGHPLKLLSNIIVRYEDAGKPVKMGFSATAILSALFDNAKHRLREWGLATEGIFDTEIFYQELIASVSIGDTYSHKSFDLELYPTHQPVKGVYPEFVRISSAISDEEYLAFDWPAILFKSYGWDFFTSAFNMTLRNHNPAAEEYYRELVRGPLDARYARYRSFESIARMGIYSICALCDANPDEGIDTICVVPYSDKDFSSYANRFLDEHPNIDAIFQVYAYNDAYCISGRTTGSKNVAKLMGDYFHGGGHMNAAGGTLGPISDPDAERLYRKFLIFPCPS